MVQSLLSSIFLSPNPTSLLPNLTTFQKPYPRPISAVHVALPPTTKKPPPRLLTTSAVNKTTTSAVAISRGRNKLTTEKKCNAKFVCTIGPATCTEGEMEALARDQGTSMVSIKMCHGEKDWYRTVIGHMRSLNKDTEGSERHMGDFGGATSSAKEGDVWTFSIKAFHTTLPKHMVDVNYDGFGFDVKVGDEVLVDGGMTRFEVIEKIGHDVISRCIDPGLILPRQSSTNKQFGSRKNTHRIPKGVIHIQASFKNTIVTVTDLKGQVLSWSSCGTCDKLTPTSFLSSQERFGGDKKNKKFKGAEKGTPFVAQMAAKKAIHKVVNQGMHQAEVRIKGPGPGRDATLRAIVQSGIRITFIRDLTPMPHNGCRPPKKRRLSRN